MMSLVYKDFQRPGTNLFYDTFFYPDEEDVSYILEEDLSKKKLETNLFTDKYGNRNSELFDDLDIMICGDSFSSLVMLKQDQTIQANINQLSNFHANSIRIKGVFGFDNNIKYIATRYSKPKLLVYEIVERNMHAISVISDSTIYPFEKKNKIGDTKTISTIKKFINEGLDLPSLRYLQYKLQEVSVHYPTAENDKNFLFLEGKNYKKYTDYEIDQVVSSLLKMKELTEANGMQFVFLPIPNKETIKYKDIPLEKRPDNLPRLFLKMEKYNIPYINVLDDFERSKTNIYLKGDTHINAHGSSIVAKEMVKYIENISEKDF